VALRSPPSRRRSPATATHRRGSLKPRPPPRIRGQLCRGRRWGAGAPRPPSSPSRAPRWRQPSAHCRRLGPVTSHGTPSRGVAPRCTSVVRHGALRDRSGRGGALRDKTLALARLRSLEACGRAHGPFPHGAFPMARSAGARDIARGSCARTFSSVCSQIICESLPRLQLKHFSGTLRTELVCLLWQS